MKIIKDGNAYIVAKDGFINLQESSEYFFIEEKELESFLFAIRRNIFIEIRRRLDREVAIEKIRNPEPTSVKFTEVYNKEHVDNIFDEKKSIFWEHDEKSIDWHNSA